MRGKTNAVAVVVFQDLCNSNEWLDISSRSNDNYDNVELHSSRRIILHLILFRRNLAAFDASRVIALHACLAVFCMLVQDGTQSFCNVAAAQVSLQDIELQPSIGFGNLCRCTKVVVCDFEAREGAGMTGASLLALLLYQVAVMAEALLQIGRLVFRR